MQGKLLKTLVLIMSAQLGLAPTVSLAAEKKKGSESEPNYNIRELALPSEVSNLGKTAGSIFYSPSVKGKVLIPVNFWGEVRKSGLHFVPIDTTLVRGLSMAGGPTTDAELDEVKLTRVKEGVITSERYDLADGGDEQASLEKLRPGDTVFVPKDEFTSNRSYYTSLIGVIATVLSSILLYREVRRNR